VFQSEDPVFEVEMTSEEQRMIDRRNAENWLYENRAWLPKLSEGCPTGDVSEEGKPSTFWVNKRLKAGISYGVLHRPNFDEWKLTAKGREIAEEMEIESSLLHQKVIEK